MSTKKDADVDPVISEYDVYITPQLQDKLYLLQFPSRQRDMPYNEDAKNKPCEMRLKPDSGFVEMDVPLNTEIYYNHEKATDWGGALAQSKSEGTEGYGMAVGFAPNSNTKGPRSKASTPATSASEENVHNLKHQTLGGQIMHEEPGKPNYMIGTFISDKGELHLTRLDGIVQMRPQFHHIDARSQVERNRVRRERETTESSAAAKSHAVQVSYSSADPEQSEQATTKTLLQAAQDESWRRLQYHDQEEASAYNSYNQHLFLGPDRQGTDLASAMNNERYLDAISAPRLDHQGNARVKPMTKKQKAAIELFDNEPESGPVPEVAPNPAPEPTTS